MEDEKKIVEEINMLFNKHRKYIQLKDLEQNKCYCVLFHHEFYYGTEKCFIVKLLDIEKNKDIYVVTSSERVYNIAFACEFIKYKGLKEIKNKPGEFLHDIRMLERKGEYIPYEEIISADVLFLTN